MREKNVREISSERKSFSGLQNQCSVGKFWLLEGQNVTKFIEN